MNSLEDMVYIENDHERIILLRKRLNKSQYQFAKDLGISVSYLGQIENYKTPVTQPLRKRVNDFLRREKELYAKDIFSYLG
ncbi:helix-turn-helix transcriptional regulator [Gracilibacillus sp. YIM 98692]|uniref:helix-turn-helix domain-containing protein n=1 Tax=Gracilibacillus sp. YIM 98692 TaxID=2663532 RepID=UPI0013D1CAB2|nr:helix-turn-helix transcriptional regulator [Gracilibacillus sp. YIM 98692]